MPHHVLSIPWSPLPPQSPWFRQPPLALVVHHSERPCFWPWKDFGWRRFVLPVLFCQEKKQHRDLLCALVPMAPFIESPLSMECRSRIQIGYLWNTRKYTPDTSRAMESRRHYGLNAPRKIISGGRQGWQKLKVAQPPRRNPVRPP